MLRSAAESAARFSDGDQGRRYLHVFSRLVCLALSLHGGFSDASHRVSTLTLHNMNRRYALSERRSVQSQSPLDDTVCQVKNHLAGKPPSYSGGRVAVHAKRTGVSDYVLVDVAALCVR
jgi:hypothetical protein